MLLESSCMVANIGNELYPNNKIITKYIYIYLKSHANASVILRK